MSHNQSKLLTFARRFGGAVAVALALLSAPLVQAQAVPDMGGEWSQTGLTTHAFELITPTSGALLALTPDGVSRSDDGGTTWRTVQLPGPPPKFAHRIVVDPTNHDVIYFAGEDGIHKTDDGGASWRLLVPVDPAGLSFLRLSVSPADPRIVYLAESKWKSWVFRFKRSLDGGTTWETLDERPENPHVTCYWAMPLLQPHPTDPNRVFRAGACQVRSQHADVEESRDQGVTWKKVFSPPLAEPNTLVGGAPDRPDRLLMAMRKDNHGGGSRVVRSDDGATWTTLLDYFGGGGMSGGGPDVAVSGLAIDPTRGDRVLVSLRASKGNWAMPAPLKLSHDGGTTWTDISPPGMGWASDVKIGIDGRTMYAATESGVWRAAAPN